MKDHRLSDTASAALREIRVLCRRTGATLSIDRDAISYDARLTAPSGFRWGGDLHEFVDFCYRPWRNDFEDLLARATAAPPEPCTEPDCDWCAP